MARDLDALAVGTIGANAAALLTLLILFFWTATSAVFEAQAKKDKHDRWWDANMVFEEETTLKIVFNALILAIGCGTLFVPMKTLWHPTKGLMDRFNFGVLAASMFMFGNMLFISFWYLVNFGESEEKRNQKNNNRNNNNNNDDANNNNNEEEEEYEMSDQELAVYHRKVGAIVHFVLAWAFVSYSFFLYKKGRKLRETGHGAVNRSEPARTKGAAHMELITELWKLLTACTITIFAALYITTCILLGGEEAENMREEGYIFNLISVQMWLIAVTSLLAILGRKVLGDKKTDGTLGVGVLSGGTLYYAVLMFMVCILYAAPALKDHKHREDGIGPAIATSFACFFFSFLYLAFALGMFKYQRSIIGAIPEEDFVMVEREPAVEMGGHVEVGEPVGDFQRMGDEANDFQRVDEPVGDGKRVYDEVAGDFEQMDDEPKSELEQQPEAPSDNDAAPAGDFELMDEDKPVQVVVENASSDSKPAVAVTEDGPKLEMV